ncbi:hypothetical protein OKW76_16130 [Sphingomonas sp. S1-29]|uniref:hypothetical protein n=1 Tax=Sphingomonas sp. S1-29 TaxID=2991074 RepID=UPI00223F5177|nr:hypothetical protein [Sphingomonas sp. S1-29]UZK69505.1 hypothetical protein OKW76_16130 [Sphingomonas sp. S1-29]
MRHKPPLWLRAPSRFAGLGKTQARLLLALALLLVLLSFQALFLPPLIASEGASNAAAGDGDLLLYESIVSGLHAGGDYYSVAADLLRAGNYPLRPFVTFRLPTLAVVQASLPPFLVASLMIAIAAAAGVVWLNRLRADALGSAPALLVGAVMLAGGLIAFVQTGLWAFHEFWAAPLIALSLGLRRPGRWESAAAIGLMAVLIRETALVYLVVMAVFAWTEGERREALGWGAAIGLFGVALTFHAIAVAGITTPFDPASGGWSGLHGFGLFVRSITLATALLAVPLWIAAPLVALALFGWLGWRDPLGLRVAATLAGYAVVIATFGRLDTFYWGVMAAPLLLVGLVFVPDSLRDLGVAALDRRRVRVQRIVR